MASRRRRLADLVTAELAAANLSQPLTVVGRQYAPRFVAPKTPVHRQVTVAIGESSQAGHPMRDGTATEDLNIELCLEHSLESPGTLALDEIDPLTDLLEEVADYFRYTKATLGNEFRFDKADIMVWEEHLRERHQFTGFVTLTFRWTG